MLLIPVEHPSGLTAVRPSHLWDAEPRRVLRASCPPGYAATTATTRSHRAGVAVRKASTDAVWQTMLLSPGRQQNLEATAGATAALSVSFTAQGVRRTPVSCTGPRPLHRSVSVWMFTNSCGGLSPTAGKNNLRTFRHFFFFKQNHWSSKRISGNEKNVLLKSLFHDPRYVCSQCIISHDTKCSCKFISSRGEKDKETWGHRIRTHSDTLWAHCWPLGRKHWCHLGLLQAQQNLNDTLV